MDLTFKKVQMAKALQDCDDIFVPQRLHILQGIQIKLAYLMRKKID